MGSAPAGHLKRKIAKAVRPAGEVGGPASPARADREAATPAGIHLALAVVVAVHGLLAWFGRQIHIQTGQDDAWYVLLARALRDFRYVDLHVVGQPTHQLYPPGYPAALALWSTIGGEHPDWLIAFSILCSMAAVALTFVLARRLFDPTIALLIAAAVGLNPALIDRAGMIMSEPLFVLCVMAVLTLLATPEPTRARLVAAGALTVLAALTRSIGTVLIAAVGLHWLLERRWRATAALAIGSALTVGAWLYWTTIAPEQFVGKSYIADAAAVVRRHSPLEILFNRSTAAAKFYMGRALPNALEAPSVPGTWIDNAAIVALLGVGLAAGLTALVRRSRAAALFLVGYAGLLLYWPWQVDRFMIPLLPLVVPTVLAGLRTAGQMLGRARWGLALGVAVVATLAVNGALSSSRKAWDRSGCDRSLPMSRQPCLPSGQLAFFQALEFIDARYPSDITVAAAKSAPLYYYIGRATPPVGSLMAQSDSSMLPYLRQTGTDVVLLGTLHANEHDRLRRRLLPNCLALDLDAAFPPHTYVLRPRSPGSGPADGEACAALEAHPSRNFDEKAPSGRARAFGPAD